MYVFRTVDALRNYLGDRKGRSIGFVPTMGALHDGHLSLLRTANEGAEVSVVSIFVNPTQFNDPKDLEKYPRTLDVDLDMLYAGECEVVFIPSVKEIYPPGEIVEQIDLGVLDTVMEGKFRPGHFAGVVQVVRRLLEIVEPDTLYMGQKDFQQVVVCRHLIRVCHLPVELVMCPTIREPSGLAMSSRNALLSPEERRRASVIYSTLASAREKLGTASTSELEEEVLADLSIPGFRPEYFSIVDGNTLQPVTDNTVYTVACCAVWAGEVRLIDNLILSGMTV